MWIEGRSPVTIRCSNPVIFSNDYTLKIRKYILMPNTPNSFSKTMAYVYYRTILVGGRVLRKMMWKLTAFRNEGVSYHPKHKALGDEHHHWYATSIKKGWRVLDLGCDRGGHIAAVLDAGAARVVGLEKNRAAMRNVPKGDFADYIAADLETSLPLANETFDAVLALDVIEHLHNRDVFLAEILRVIKPGGTLLLSAPNIKTKWKTTARKLGLFEYSDPDHKIEYEQSELVGQIERAGFEIISLTPVVFDTPWDGWIDFLGAISMSAYRALWMIKRNKALKHPDQSTGFRVTALRPIGNG